MEIEGARHSRILAFENSSEFEADYQPIVVLTIDLRWPTWPRSVWLGFIAKIELLNLKTIWVDRIYDL